MRRGITYFCALALAAGSAVAASTITTRTLQAQYADISLEVSGQKITLTDAKGNPVEPFAVDGTVYIPARALGDILGKEVLWDASTHTVSVGKAPLMEDAETLISAVEGSHPAFLLNRVPEGYAAARQAMLDTAGDPASTAADFAWSALAYTASLRDGHTSINPFGNGARPFWTSAGRRTSAISTSPMRPAPSPRRKSPPSAVFPCPTSSPPWINTSRRRTSPPGT